MPTTIYNMGLCFKAVAVAHGARGALAFPDGSHSDYASLDAASDVAAAHLLKAGAKCGAAIAIFAEKSLLTYTAMLAALKIGAPYVVLDTASPMARIEKILERAQPALVLADRAFSYNGITVLPLAALAENIAPVPLCVIEAVEGTTPAYLMFTSGSTGFPKGVVISHTSMVSFVRWARETFSITPEDVCSGANALYFDNSVFDFCASLFNGACLVPLNRDTVTDPKALVSATNDCSIWFSVPSLLVYLTTLRALGAGAWPRMRAIIFGGEGFPKTELKKLHGLYGKQATLWNVYGPTECTCICSAYAIGECDFEDMGKLAPLGLLAPDFFGAVMDETGTREMPAGEVGELFLMGPQVALGYCNAPELTAKAFAKNPLPPFASEPCYRTGDLVRCDPATGYYHFCGRKDNQIKHMGYRIELEEIEAALHSFSEVAQAAVIYRKNAGHGGGIIAFVSLDSEITADALKKKLRDTLPSYMVPEEVHLQTVLPKNANGKVDRKALAADYGAEHG